MRVWRMLQHAARVRVYLFDAAECERLRAAGLIGTVLESSGCWAVLTKEAARC